MTKENNQYRNEYEKLCFLTLIEQFKDDLKKHRDVIKGIHQYYNPPKYFQKNLELNAKLFKEWFDHGEKWNELAKPYKTLYEKYKIFNTKLFDLFVYAYLKGNKIPKFGHSKNVKIHVHENNDSNSLVAIIHQSASKKDIEGLYRTLQAYKKKKGLKKNDDTLEYIHRDIKAYKLSENKSYEKIFEIFKKKQRYKYDSSEAVKSATRRVDRIKKSIEKELEEHTTLTKNRVSFLK